MGLNKCRSPFLTGKLLIIKVDKCFTAVKCELLWGIYIMETQKNEIRLHEGELNVMELLWSNRELAAKDISKIIKEYIGWEKNTTYTVIKRLIDKGAIERIDPGFLCRAKINKRTVQSIETEALFSKLYNSSLNNFFVEYLRNRKMTSAELFELERIIDEQKNGSLRFN